MLINEGDGAWPPDGGRPPRILSRTALHLSHPHEIFSVSDSEVRSFVDEVLINVV